MYEWVFGAVICAMYEGGKIVNVVARMCSEKAVTAATVKIEI